MSILMPRIAARLFGEPLMVDPAKLSAILMGIGGRVVEGGVVFAGVPAVDHTAFAGGRPSDAMGRLGEPLRRQMESKGFSVHRVGAVGVIPIEGTLVHKGAFVGQSSGETSYEGIQTLVGMAARDESIKGVVLEVDSFGGEVSGAFETAAAIAALSKAKPTLAILTDFALSAGYLLASAARRIVMPPTGAAGSIGVISAHLDMSRKLDREGVTVTLITSGAHKAEGHPALPLADSTRSEMQARVDRAREMFVSAVGAQRGRRLTRDAAFATEARVYHGADAVAAGLVDGIIDSSTAFSAFVERVK